LIAGIRIAAICHALTKLSRLQASPTSGGVYGRLVRVHKYWWSGAKSCNLL